MNIHTSYNMSPDSSIDDPALDDHIIFQNFMKELCRRDDEEANRNPNLEDGNANLFSVEEIRQHVLNGFALEIVLPVLRGLPCKKTHSPKRTCI
jgi:hypothetical protein